MKYSVWLRLSDASRTQIQRAITSLALKCNTPVFPAHVTLATNLESLEEARIFVSQFTKPKSLRIDPRPHAVTENTRWQTTVVLPVLNLNLDGLPYPPHISLVYHESADASMRVALAEALALELDGLTEGISVGEVQVWSTEGGFQGIPSWKEIRVDSGQKFFDVAVNLSDAMFDGVYHEKTKHPNDRAEVVQRAIQSGCERMLLLGGSVQDSTDQLRLARELDGEGCHLFTTVGVHPTRTSDFLADRDIPLLREIIRGNLDRVVALGEIGLDSEREHFAPMEKQVAAFEAQLVLADEFRLPLLLHFRGSSCFDNFRRILQAHRASFSDGVVHSFTGTREEAHVITSELGLSIGINGCSLRDEPFLQEVLPTIPSSKLVFETDAPYCDIRPTHPSHKFVRTTGNRVMASKPEKWVSGCIIKGRNEPCLIAQVADVVRQVHPEADAIVGAGFENASRIFARSQ